MFQLSRGKHNRPMTPSTSAPSSPDPADRLADDESKHLRVLGLAPGSTWDDVRRAHAALVSDLTPGPEACHTKVGLANRLLDEVNQAYTSLRARTSVA